ncbi:MAG: hypothetical protein Kow0075_15720 [Salibacteraceae bacterium]
MARRVRLYLIGVVLGTIIAILIFGGDNSRDLDIWMPGQRILESIRNDSSFLQSPQLTKAVECCSISKQTMSKLWSEGTVSVVSGGGSPYVYEIQCETSHGNLLCRVSKQNDRHTLVFLKLGETNNCNCAE